MHTGYTQIGRSEHNPAGIRHIQILNNLIRIAQWDDQCLQ